VSLGISGLARCSRVLTISCVSDDGWRQFVKQFAESIRHITGQNLEATLGSDDREALLQEELESLRCKVDELSEEVSALQHLQLPNVLRCHGSVRGCVTR
jgi:hypothetical protein